MLRDFRLKRPFGRSNGVASRRSSRYALSDSSPVAFSKALPTSSPLGSRALGKVIWPQRLGTS